MLLGVVSLVSSGKEGRKDRKEGGREACKILQIQGDVNTILPCICGQG